MIFSSDPFIFLFLPIAVLGYYGLALIGRIWAAVWLVLMSFVFYGYWNPSYVLLLVGSIAWNYSVGALIFAQDEEQERRKFWLLWLGIAGNLGLLCYYKYLFPLIGFLAAHHLAPVSWEEHVFLPLGISFFTFTQIGYLVDSYDGKARERDLLSYLLFVTFFPHLIAGPILHNREMMPQFANKETYRLKSENIAVGLFIFATGLSKKVLMADPLGFVADKGWSHPADLSAGAAAMTVLSYAMQLYFDFSGYSDMAIGIARMFGVVFPANFNSPYRATSIIEFWSRWHMTLTRYLTLYLYNPVAMRVSRARVARGLPVSKKATRNLPAFASLIVWPTFFTMTLAGIWHGAGLQFLIFGLLHAFYLSANHAWRMFGPKSQEDTGLLANAGCLVLTFGCVLLGQIFFRAGSTPDAFDMLSALAGFGGDVPAYALSSVTNTTARIVFGAAICLIMPNTQQLTRDWRPILEQVTEPPVLARLKWRPTILWAVITGIVTLAALLHMSDTSRFLYFQF
jgi:D-alanyl-lipoteichoic acid acyltransferase DltB (MBOAT superfamily)